MSSTTVTRVEQDRSAHLMDAQVKAHQLFEEIGRDIVRPGITESAMTKEIYDLGESRFGIHKHWHKRVVRSGPNTLSPYDESPADREIQPDDILFIDLGPVFEDWEADFGRTFVLGDDPKKIALRDSLEPVWQKAKAAYAERPQMTGEDLYDIACKLATEAGWEFGGRIAGHIVGEFPHDRIPNDKVTLYITKGSLDSMDRVNRNGHKQHWILEIHLVDRERQIGAFMEQLLTID